jgi:hypothetical protein
MMSGDEIRTNRLARLLREGPLDQAKSFAQGMSNAAASNVSGPVDALAWLLRKTGLPIPQNPMGGSEWMAEKGLTAAPNNRLAALLGEGAGLSAPIAAFAKAPKIAGGLLALDDHAMEMGRKGIEGYMNKTGMIQPATVWHGPLRKNDMLRDDLQDLISSQRYLNRDIVAKKIKEGNFQVRVTPEFFVNGEKVRAITDGHHALEAAIRSGNRPKFTIDTAQTNDRIGLLNRGAIDDYLETSYHDSPWYRFATKDDLF